MENNKFDMLTAFCNIMETKLPDARMIEDYFRIIQGFSDLTVEAAFKEWRFLNANRFPSPKDLQDLLIEVNQDLEIKSGPRTVEDLFGKRVRCATPLAKELQGILKQLIGTPQRSKDGKIIACGTIDVKRAQELVEEAERKYGPAKGEVSPMRRSAQDCLVDGCVDEDLAVRGQKKKGGPFELKITEDERDELRKAAKCLRPFGHFVVGVKDGKLLIKSLDYDVWQGSIVALKEMAERL